VCVRMPECGMGNLQRRPRGGSAAGDRGQGMAATPPETYFPATYPVPRSTVSPPFVDTVCPHRTNGVFQPPAIGGKGQGVPIPKDPRSRLSRPPAAAFSRKNLRRANIRHQLHRWGDCPEGCPPCFASPLVHFGHLQIVGLGHRGAVAVPCADNVQGIFGRQFRFATRKGEKGRERRGTFYFTGGRGMVESGRAKDSASFTGRVSGSRDQSRQRAESVQLPTVANVTLR